MTNFLKTHLTFVLIAITLIFANIIIVTNSEKKSTLKAEAKESISISEFLIPQNEYAANPYKITSGADGNIWFTLPNLEKIGRITTNGIVTEFPSTNNINGGVWDIAASSDGNLWFTKSSSNSIGRITPSGEITEFPLTESLNRPTYITFGHDGNIWFSVFGNTGDNKIGRITPDGTLKEFPLSSNGNYPNDLTAGPDGNIWFIESTTVSPQIDMIAKITPEGEITTFQLPPSRDAMAITAGSDGNIWFTEGDFNGDRLSGWIAKITPEGIITEYPLPRSSQVYGISLNGIVKGPDGNIWFTEGEMNQIGKITTDGKITEYTIPTEISGAYDITAGPDGNIWFTESFENKIGRVNLSDSVVSTPKSDKTPVIFIPGIMGSELVAKEKIDSSIRDCGVNLFTISYKKNEIVWPNANEAVSFCDDYFDVLKLLPDGQTGEYQQVQLNGTIIEKVGADPVYEPTINYFVKDKGYKKDKDFFIFPYDWRKDLNISSLELDSKINEILQKTGSQKVHIIAHSMGGLVARDYIRDSQKAVKVDTLVTLGTPHAGSPKAIATLLYGNCPFTVKVLTVTHCVLSDTEIVDITRNFTGIYELLPSMLYYQLYHDLLPFSDDRNVDNNTNTQDILDYNEFKLFIDNLDKNTTALNAAESFHNLLDSNYGTTNGVKTYLIAGSGFATIGQIHDYQTQSGLVKVDALATNGDDTVPIKSATLMQTNNVYYVNQKHGDLSLNRSLDMAYNLINGQTAPIQDVKTAPYDFEGGVISIHSPAEVHAYDQNGNHTGPVKNGYEENIPGSSYTQIGDSKFIFLPKGGSYNITTNATGVGTFDLKWKKYENSQLVQEQLYFDVPQTRTTKTSMDLNVPVPKLKIDSKGNGRIDRELLPSKTLQGSDVKDLRLLIKKERE